MEGVTLALKVLIELKHGESEGVEIGVAQQVWPDVTRKAEIGLIGREDQGEIRGLDRVHEVQSWGQSFECRTKWVTTLVLPYSD